MNVCHLLPRLPPATDGIGLYALRLAEGLAARHGVRSRFLVADPAWRPAEGSAVEAEPLPEASAGALAAALEREGGCDVVLLHYVGYGYDSQGLPFWLARGIEAWRRTAAGQRGRLVILFHELWATGPVWTKVFFTIGLQKAIVRRLVRAANASFTTTRCYHRNLEREARRFGISARPPVPILAAAPGDGDPLPLAGSDGLRLLVFGLPWTRLAALRAHRKLLRAWEREGRIGKIVLLGKADPGGEAEEDRRIGRIAPGLALAGRIERRRDASEAEIVAAFRGADLYLSGHPASLICKSTTILAAMAAGCPVLPADDGGEAAPLAAGVHFACAHELGDGPVDRARLREIGLAGRDWWRRHASEEVVVGRIAAILQAAAEGAGR